MFENTRETLARLEIHELKMQKVMAELHFLAVYHHGQIADILSLQHIMTEIC